MGLSMPSIQFYFAREQNCRDSANANDGNRSALAPHKLQAGLRLATEASTGRPASLPAAGQFLWPDAGRESRAMCCAEVVGGG